MEPAPPPVRLKDDFRRFCKGETNRPGQWKAIRAMPANDQDQLLIDRCLKHQEGSWPEFVDRFLGLVYHVVRHTAYCRSMTLSPADEDDVVAEILLEVVRNDYALLRQFKGTSSLAAYLTVVTRRTCVRQLVRMRRENALGHVKAHRTAVEDTTNGIEPILAAEEVERLLGMLEKQQADVVRMYHLDFMSYRDIAKKIGVEENSIGSILSRARQRIAAVAK